MNQFIKDRYKEIVELTNDAIIVIDEEGGVEIVNKKVADWLGYNKEEIDGQKLLDLPFMSLENRAIVIKELNDRLKGKKVPAHELVFFTKDGDKRIGLVRVYTLRGRRKQPTYSVLIITDITKYKKIEVERDELQERYSLIGENSDDLIATTTLESDPIFIYISPSFKRLLGYKPEELIGHHSRNLINPEDNKKFVLLIKEIIHAKKNGESSKRGLSTEIRLRIKDKKEKWHNVLSNINVMGEELLVVSQDITERKRAQQMAKESEEKFKNFFENANDALIFLDLDGKIVDVNKKTEKVFESKRQNLIGKNFLKLSALAKRDISRLEKALKEVLEGENPLIELNIRDKKKQRIYLECSANAVKFDNEINGILIIARDLTANQAAEEALRENEERLKNFFNNANDLIQSVDRGGMLIYVNRKWLDILGYTKKEIKHLTFWQIVKKEEYPNVRKIFNRVRRNKKTSNIETVLVTKAGREIYVEGNVHVRMKDNKFIAIQGIFHDVTERKLIEHELRDSEKKFRTLIENAPIGIFYCTFAGKLLYGNRRTEEILGYTKKALEGKSFFELKLLNKKDVSRIAELLAYNILGKSTGPDEFVFNRKDGSKAMVEINTGVVSVGGEDVVLGMIYDIAERKKIESMKNEFVSIASHQLRTPLTGIKWLGDLLLKSKEEPISGQQKSMIEQIFKSNERMLLLINDLLDVSHIESGRKFEIKKKKINFIDKLTEIIEENKPIITEKKIILENKIPNELVINADPDKFKQAFNNIFSNALKYNRDGKKVILSYESDHKYHTFHIQDNGFGIPQKQHRKVFDKFFRADNIVSKEIGGTGLGLYITKAIIEAHGGKIWFESMVNQGTTFSFSIPKK